MKESKYKATAQEKLKTLQKQRAELESQFQSETSLLEGKFNPSTENLESVSISPTKTNISTRLIALLWTPRWSDEQQKTTPAWQ